MKKRIASIVSIAIALLLCGVFQAQASIVIDGTASAGEWNAANIILSDKQQNHSGSWYANEPGREGSPNVYYDNYDIEELRVEDGSYLSAMFDVYGTPSLAAADGDNAKWAYYLLALDTNSDLTIDYKIYYNLNNGGKVYLKRMSDNAMLGEGTGAIGSVVEFGVPFRLFGSDWPFCETKDVGVYGYLDNGDGGFDDYAPDGQGGVLTNGPLHHTPEPTSMLLLGVGLIGLAGRRIKNRFKA